MKIGIYTDDAPISEDRLASGMSRVNSRLFKLLFDNVSVIVTTNIHDDFNHDYLEPKLKTKIKAIKYNSYLLRFAKKINKVFLSKLHFDIYTIFKDRETVCEIVNSNADTLFIPLGADIRAYKRAIEISRKTKIPLNVYIVDDFMSSAKISNDKYAMKLCNRFLTSYLNNTNKIFTISEGMRVHLLNKYHVNSVVLNLPFEKKFLIRAKPVKQILFLGSLSHFYIDGILDLLSQLRRYNNNHNQRIILKITANKLHEKIKEYSDIIDLSKVDGEKNLATEINKSLFCYVPYSFEDKYKTMVKTSFPSKTLEYLSYARKILVYGPDYSSSVKYFKDNNLNTYIDQRKPELIYDAIQNSTINVSDYSADYNRVIEKYHSYSSVRDKILSYIADE